jgi:UDP-glucose 4-epimerase
MPFLSQVAVGRRPHINVFGNDYPTPDGTGVRDYIHIMDLAEGHIAALKKIEKAAAPKGQKPLIVNLGTGKGYSVLEMIRAFEKSSGQKIAYRITRRRPGDVATLYADTQLARKALGWKAKRNLADMCTDAWRWQSSHPEGYAGSSARPVKKNPG